jgi:hypothetical protein
MSETVEVACGVKGPVWCVPLGVGLASGSVSGSTRRPTNPRERRADAAWDRLACRHVRAAGAGVLGHTETPRADVRAVPGPFRGDGAPAGSGVCVPGVLLMRGGAGVGGRVRVGLAAQGG